MGFRGHVRKVNKIEYGDGVGNHMKESFENYFREYDCQFPNDSLYFDKDMFDNSDTWEFEKTAFAKMIENIKSASDEQKALFGSIFNEEKDFANPDEAFAYATRCFEDWITESDPTNEYVVIDWF